MPGNMPQPIFIRSVAFHRLAVFVSLSHIVSEIHPFLLLHFSEGSRMGAPFPLPFETEIYGKETFFSGLRPPSHHTRKS